MIFYWWTAMGIEDIFAHISLSTDIFLLRRVLKYIVKKNKHQCVHSRNKYADTSLCPVLVNRKGPQWLVS